MLIWENKRINQSELRVYSNNYFGKYYYSAIQYVTNKINKY